MENNIDQFFREKVDQYDITPSGQAWEQVRKSISEEKKPIGMWYWSAAAILLVLMGAIFYLNHSSQITSEDIALIDRPLPLATYEWHLSNTNYQSSSKDLLKYQEMIYAENNQKSKGIKSMISQDTSFRNIYQPKSLKLSLAYHGKVHLNQTLKTDKENAGEIIRIIYIASEKEEKNSRLTGVLNTLNQLSDRPLLSDLRSAKDNLLRQSN